jgi:hypothetical protein
MDTRNNEDVDAARRGQRNRRSRQRDAREHQLDVEQTSRHQARQHNDASTWLAAASSTPSRLFGSATIPRPAYKNCRLLFSSANTPRATYKNYRLRWHKIVRALHYLVVHHAGYQNVTISDEDYVDRYTAKKGAEGMPKNGSGGKIIYLFCDDDVPDLLEDSEDELSDDCEVSSVRISDVKARL